MNLVLSETSKPRNRKRKIPSSIARLDVLRGPHPHVHFDHLDWLTVPYDNGFAQEPEKTFYTAEVPKGQSKVEGVLADHARPKEEGIKGISKLPTRPSAKEVLLYAQLSSVSAPIMRRSSHDQESEDGYANGFLYDGDGDLEQRMSEADNEDPELGPVG